MEIFANTRIQEVVIHDLRTPLNVIRLALRMLEDSHVSLDPDAAEDLAMIRANEAELERMLTYLVDVGRLPRDRSQLFSQPFDPRRLIGDVVADPDVTGRPVPIETVDDGSCTMVNLDYNHAKMAVERALVNVASATGGKPVRVRLTGGPDRCIIAFESDVVPRNTVFSHTITTDEFERILGTPGERRGLDLVIAGKISSLFGGSARLEVAAGRGTSVILDWPSRMGGIGQP